MGKKERTLHKKKIVILGAGITGLVAAYFLSDEFEVTLFEEENYFGGTARNFKYKEFTLDYGPHKIYTELEGVIPEIGALVPLIKVKKKNSIFIKGNYYSFPLKLSQIASKMPLVAFRAGLDIFKNLFSKDLPDDSYENFLINRFGRTLYELSFKNYAFKVWNSDPKHLDAELARRRVAISNIFELIKGVLFKDTKSMSAEYFYYPKEGIGQLTEALHQKIKVNNGKIILNSRIKSINLKERKIQNENSFYKYDYLISTIPLDALYGLLSEKPPIENPKFFYQDLNIIYFVLNKERALKDCWVFFPDRELLFQRVSEQKAFSPFISPKNKTVIMVETTKLLDKNLLDRITEQLSSVGILKKEEISEFFYKTVKKAYPVYKKGFSDSFSKIHKFFKLSDNVYLLGRQGLFNYNNMDQCWDMSKKISEQIKKKRSKDDWEKVEESFKNYRIVD